MDLMGKAAIVTGGGSGIGAAIATLLAGAGAKVMLAGRRDPKLAEVAAVIGDRGGTARTFAGDVTDDIHCTQLVQATLTAFGGVDILVNNAGISGHGRPLVEFDATDFDSIINTNLKSAFLMSRAVIPGMVSRGGGCIVMLSSVSGIRYYADEALYGLSKHAMNDLAQYIRVEYGRSQIHAFSICPGLVATDMGVSLKPKLPDRMLSVEEVAAFTAFAIGQSERVAIGGPIVIEPSRNPHELHPTSSRDSGPDLLIAALTKKPPQRGG